MNIKNYIREYFQNLYVRTMEEAYDCGYKELARSLSNGGTCLDCGANSGKHYVQLQSMMGLAPERYTGIEWDRDAVMQARGNGINVIQGDLNKPLPFDDNTFQCVFGFSVLEHLLNGCLWMNEAGRLLKKGGELIIITPNISTFFNIALLFCGKMCSSGPHPDSRMLLKSEALLQVSTIDNPDVEGETPLHRHLVVFSFRVLRKYLYATGFGQVRAYGYGLYPFPNFMQPVLEKLDPYHCHQMVLIAVK